MYFFFHFLMSILRPAKCKYNGVMLRDVTIQTSAHLTNLGMVLDKNVYRNAWGIYIETKNGKKTVWIFLLQKYSKFSSISLDIFIRHKSWNCYLWSYISSCQNTWCICLHNVETFVKLGALYSIYYIYIYLL